MGSSGTIGNILTTQKLGRNTMLRRKPTPTYRYTLPQAYQRWDYKDYAARWRDLTNVQKCVYAAGGSRNHLTGFQYWMHTMLSTLPDIAVRWHLDSIQDNTTIDFSHNGNTGTVIGAFQTEGLIDHSFSFDGVDDHVKVNSNSSLQFGIAPFTIEMFLYKTELYGDLVGMWIWADGAGIWGLSFKNNTTLRLYLQPGGGAPEFTIDNVLNAWHHLAFIIDPVANTLYCYQQGVYKTSKAFPHQHFSSSSRLTLARYAQSQWDPLECLIDHFVIYNRALEPHEILRHSLRRYPP